jgi:hypothetical protein
MIQSTMRRFRMLLWSTPDSRATPKLFVRLYPQRSARLSAPVPVYTLGRSHPHLGRMGSSRDVQVTSSKGAENGTYR